MELIRKIVQEELRKVLNEILEPYPKTQDKESILYNFEAGKAFGVNILSKDIVGLDNYYMSSYFPNSEMNETWMFEIETQYGSSQLVEIIHQINSNYESIWKMNIAEVERGSTEPKIISTCGPIKGYDEFIEKVNSNFGKMINPDLL